MNTCGFNYELDLVTTICGRVPFLASMLSLSPNLTANYLNQRVPLNLIKDTNVQEWTNVPRIQPYKRRLPVLSIPPSYSHFSP